MAENKQSMQRVLQWSASPSYRIQIKLLGMALKASSPGLSQTPFSTAHQQGQGLLPKESFTFLSLWFLPTALLGIKLFLLLSSSKPSPVPQKLFLVSCSFLAHNRSSNNACWTGLNWNFAPGQKLQQVQPVNVPGEAARISTMLYLGVKPAILERGSAMATSWGNVYTVPSEAGFPPPPPSSSRCT